MPEALNFENGKDSRVVFYNFIDRPTLLHETFLYFNKHLKEIIINLLDLFP